MHKTLITDIRKAIRNAALLIIYNLKRTSAEEHDAFLPAQHPDIVNASERLMKVCEFDRS